MVARQKQQTIERLAMKWALADVKDVGAAKDEVVRAAIELPREQLILLTARLFVSGGMGAVEEFADMIEEQAGA